MRERIARLLDEDSFAEEALLALLRDGWRLFGPGTDERAVEARLEARSAHRTARERRHSARRLSR